MKLLYYFYKVENEECGQEDWSASDKFGIITPCSSKYHLEMGAPVSLKVATKASFGGKKKLIKLRSSASLSKEETEECNQEEWNVSDKFWIVTPCSDTYHLEVGAPVSLKVINETYFGGKKTLKIQILGYFSKAKAEECN